MTRRSRLFPAALGLPLALLAGCGNDSPSILEPDSQAGRRVAGLWWFLFWTSVVAVAVVVGFLVVAVRRRRREPPGAGDEDDVDREPVLWGDRFVVLSGIVVTGAVLAVTFVVSLFVLDDLAASDDPDLTIEVVARDWWWEVRYPGGAVTANEVHIRVGEQVDVRLPSADVIHSFWVPELQVKEDHIPGMDNELRLEADRAGRYRGQCAEFCGLQHAHMRFYVEARRASPGRPPPAAGSRRSRPPRAPAATRSGAPRRTVTWGPTSPTWPTGGRSGPG